MVFISFSPLYMNSVFFVHNEHSLSTRWNWIILTLDVGYQNLQQNKNFNIWKFRIQEHVYNWKLEERYQTTVSLKN